MLKAARRLSGRGTRPHEGQFFGPNRAYHEARRRFVFKGKIPPRESRLSAPGGLDDLQTGAIGIQTVEPSVPPVSLYVRGTTQGNHHLPQHCQFADSTALVWA